MIENNHETIKGIYVIIDPNFINSEDPIDMTKKVLDGGAKIIQLRNKDDNTTLTVEWAKKFQNCVMSMKLFQ